MNRALLVSLALPLALVGWGCFSTRGYRDTVAPGAAVSKAEAAAEIRDALDRTEPAERRAAAESLVARLGVESDAGHVLAEALRTGELEAGLREALDALEFETVVEADLPAGFPEPSPPGLVRVKRYPVVRTARVDADSSDGSMFMELFRHIRRNDVAMTAPVDMAVADDGSRDRSMAFLYGSRDIGSPGSDGAVRIADAPPLTVVSIGLRGAYRDANFEEALGRLRTWLEENSDRYAPDGEPRVLAYNSPFVPWFMKYSEVQIPVREL